MITGIATARPLPRGLHLGVLEDVAAPADEREAPALADQHAQGGQHVEQVHGQVEGVPGQLVVAEQGQRAAPAVEVLERQRGDHGRR